MESPLYPYSRTLRLSNYGFKRWYPEKGFTTEQYEKAEERWKKLLMDIVRR